MEFRTSDSEREYGKIGRPPTNPTVTTDWQQRSEQNEHRQPPCSPTPAAHLIETRESRRTARPPRARKRWGKPVRLFRADECRRRRKQQQACRIIVGGSAIRSRARRPGCAPATEMWFESHIRMARCRRTRSRRWDGFGRSCQSSHVGKLRSDLALMPKTGDGSIAAPKTAHAFAESSTSPRRRAHVGTSKPGCACRGGGRGPLAGSTRAHDVARSASPFGRRMNTTRMLTTVTSGCSSQSRKPLSPIFAFSSATARSSDTHMARRPWRRRISSIR